MKYPDFKVCVRCFTYNQSEYITDAMNGFCIQNTDYPFVCCIVDDASTDGEQNVIIDYLHNHFNMQDSIAYEKETDYARIFYSQHKVNRNCYFAVLLLKENHYSIKKSKIGYLAEWRDMCIYEAMCEGDDYWIDYEKLQVQTDLMDKYPLCAMTYTKCKRFIQKTGLFEDSAWGGNSQTFAEFLNANTVPSLTAVYRIEAYSNYRELVKDKVFEWKMGDYPMWLYFAHEYKVLFLNRTTSTYRILTDSASHFKYASEYISFINSAIDVVDFFVRSFKYPIDFIAYKSARLSRMASSVAFLYNDLNAAKKIIRTIPNKTMKDYLKIGLMSNKVLFSIYKRFLKI